MQVVSLCPLRVASLRWPRKPGAWALTVVCKATFDLVPGEASLSAVQEFINEEDGYWDDSPERSLHAPSDLAPRKPRAEVFVVGHTFAPQREPSRSWLARLRVGRGSRAVDKVVEVHGDRTRLDDGSLHEGGRAIRVPLRYERASGGEGTPNPVGIPAASSSLPSLLLRGSARSRAGGELAGFGPIAPSWPDRRGRLPPKASPPELRPAPGARQGSPPSRVIYELPDEFDFGFFSAAPRDQQLDRLVVGDPIELENLHPAYSHVATAVPAIWPRAYVERKGVAEEIEFVCDTLWVDTDRALFTLTWRAELELMAFGEDGRVLITLEQGPGSSRGAAAWERSSRGPAARAEAEGAGPGRAAGLALLDGETVDVMHLAAGGELLEPEGAGGAGESELLEDSAIELDPEPAAPASRAASRAPEPESSWMAVTAQEGLPAVSPAGSGRTFLGDASPPWLAPPRPSAPSRPAPPQEPPPSRVDRLDRPDRPDRPERPDPRPRPERPAEISASIAPPAARPADPARISLRLLGAEPGAAERLSALAEFAERPAALGAALAHGPMTPLAELALSEGEAAVLVEGDLDLVPDETEALRLLLTIAAPVASLSGDPALRAACEATAAFLAAPAPGLLPGVSAALQTRLRGALGGAPGAPSPDRLAADLDRALALGRGFQRRFLGGRPHVRGSLSAPRAPSRPVYVPELLAAALPLHRPCRVRLLAELLPPHDPADESPLALRALALGRVVG